MREKEYNFYSSLPRSNEFLVRYTDSSWACLCSGLFALTVLAFKLSQLDTKGNAPLSCRLEGGEFIGLLVVLFQSLQPVTLV